MIFSFLMKLLELLLLRFTAFLFISGISRLKSLKIDKVYLFFEPIQIYELLNKLLMPKEIKPGLRRESSRVWMLSSNAL